MQLEEIKITGVVDDYLIECMNNGTTFIKKVFDKKDIKKMTKCTYWQKDFRPNTLNDFYWSIEIPNINNLTTAWAIDKITDFITLEKKGVCIFQERIIDSTDTFLISGDFPPYFTSEVNIYNGKEVYYFVDQSSLSDEVIAFSLSLSGRAGPFSSIAMLVLPEGLEIKKGDCLSAGLLDILASNVRSLLFGAYDLDGYILAAQ